MQNIFPFNNYMENFNGAARHAAIDALRCALRHRNDCKASAAYWRDCARDAIAALRCIKALGLA